MNKRGQSLPLNTLIIIILVVIVLIVVAIFFLGGTSSLSRSIRSIFFGTTAGTDLSLALEICEQRCEQAKSLPTDTLRRNSAFCKVGFDIDKSNDGTIGEDEDGLLCGSELDVSCQFNGADICSKPSTPPPTPPPTGQS